VNVASHFAPATRELTITVAGVSETWIVDRVPTYYSAAVELSAPDRDRPSVVCVRGPTDLCCSCGEFLWLGACRHLNALLMEGVL
jgi:hypothetical protein